MTSKTVASPSADVQAIRTAAQPIIDLTKGGEAMRSLGERYLPKFERETEDAYNARRKSTWLFDGVGKTIEDMAGKVFDRPITLEASGQVEDWATNIDLMGRDLNQFAKDVFVEAQKAGTAFVMVDAPRRDGEVTKAQAKRQNLRPYFNLLTIEQVLGWKWTTIDNAPTLTQFRIFETVQEPDPNNEFEDKTVEQVRVLDLDSTVYVRIFRKKADESWTLFDEYPTDLTAIMVAPCDLGRDGFMVAQPVHDKLAEINLAHWRIQSDKSSCLHKSLSPLLFMKGIELGEDGAAVSANAGFTSNAEFSDMKWVEIGGAGISEARDELKDLEFQMQAMGLQLVISKTGNNTATGDSIDESKTNSRLSMWADTLKDCLEQCFGWAVEVAGLSEEVTVDVNKDYAANALSHLDMDALNKMFLSGVISKETYINEAKRRNVLSEDVDPEFEIANAEDVMDEPNEGE